MGLGLGLGYRLGLELEFGSLKFMLKYLTVDIVLCRFQNSGVMLSCCCCLSFVVVVILYKVLDYLIRLPRRKNLDQNYVFITGCDTGFGHEAAKRALVMKLRNDLTLWDVT